MTDPHYMEVHYLHRPCMVPACELKINWRTDTALKRMNINIDHPFLKDVKVDIEKAMCEPWWWTVGELEKKGIYICEHDEILKKKNGYVFMAVSHEHWWKPEVFWAKQGQENFYN